MRKFIFVLALTCSLFCANARAGSVIFRMDATTTDLVLGGDAVTVTLSAKVVDSALTSSNDLNYWSLSALVDSDGVVEVVGGSIAPLTLVPSVFGLTYTSINQSGGLLGGSGSIDYLNLQPNQSVPIDIAGVDFADFVPIAQFDIQAAAGAVQGQSARYTLGETNAFGGILADGFTFLDGQFDVSSVRTFTVVPEPSSLLILSGLGMIGYLRRKR